MASSSPSLDAVPFLPRPGPRRNALLAGLYVALTMLFVAIGFPYERIAERLAGGLGSAVGARASIARLEPGISWGLPQLRLWDVDLAWPGGTRLHFDRVRLRPAWSTAWFTGQPAFVVALREGPSDLDGTFRFGRHPGFQGTLAQVDLARLPVQGFVPGLLLAGAVDADVDVRQAESVPEGTVAFHARDGSVTLPGLPVGIPFDTLQGDLALGGDALLTVNALALDGPLASFTASGTVGQAASWAMAPLALAARVEAREPMVRQMLGGAGVRLGADGAAELSIVGTLGAPNVRAAGARPPAAGARSPAAGARPPAVGARPPAARPAP